MIIDRRTLTTTIAAGQVLSGAIDAGHQQALVGLRIPTGWASGTLSLLVSEDGVAYSQLYDSMGSPVTVAAVADGRYSLDPAATLPWRYWQAQAASAPATPMTITLIARSVG